MCQRISFRHGIGILLRHFYFHFCLKGEPFSILLNLLFSFIYFFIASFAVSTVLPFMVALLRPHLLVHLCSLQPSVFGGDGIYVLVGVRRTLPGGWRPHRRRPSSRSGNNQKPHAAQGGEHCWCKGGEQEKWPIRQSYFQERRRGRELQNPPVGPSDCLLPRRELGGARGPFERAKTAFNPRRKRSPPRELIILGFRCII